jgi:single stranded DNA-binding protein
MPNINVNRVVLVGRLTHDPDLRALPSGSNVCELRLACNSSKKEPDGGYREKPNYFAVSAYGAAALNVSRYLSRGSRVVVDGRLEWQQWETGDGQKRQAVKILADTVQFLDPPNGPHRKPATQRERDTEDTNWEEGHGESDTADLKTQVDQTDQLDRDSELASDFDADSRNAELVF